MIFKSVSTIKGVGEIKDFAERNGLCYKTAQILTQRGIDTDTKLHSFFNPTLDDLRDPFLLSGMTECNQRIQKAIDNNQSILLYGDYDVDGISAVTILYNFLKDKVSNLNYFLPSRYVDGYGLTIDSAKKVIEQFKPDLIITVDCGITCVDEVEFIKSQNIDIIITDHHEPLEVLPNTIVVDPKIEDQQYGFNGLCGAGVALKVVQSFVGKNNLNQFLPVCAIATVSDIVPLVDENRSIVKLGLALQQNLPQGLKKLTKNLKINTINSQAISFKIAPRLNAAGRMGNAYTALDLFVSEDQNTLNNSLQTLLEQNAQRQMLSQEIYTDCLAEIKQNKLYQNKAIILKSENWDSGLLGIACARLVDDFCKPVFLFSEVDGELKGSVRSFGDINVHALLSHCNQVLDTFGGHTMAAGLSLKADNFEQFKLQVYYYLQKNTTDRDYLPIKTYDVLVNTDDLTLKFAKELDLLEPFGCNNPVPQFMISYKDCKVSKLANFAEHLNLTIDNTFKLIHFNSAEYFDDYFYTELKQSIFELQINEYKGKEYVKGLVKYSNFAGVDKKLEPIANGRKLKQLYNEKEVVKDIKFFKHNQTNEVFNNLLNGISGTAIMIDSYKTYQKFKETLSLYDLNYYVGTSQSKFAENCVIFALDDISSISNYKNIVFLDGLLTRSCLQNYNGNIFAISDIPCQIEFLNTERSYFGLVFNAIKTVLQKGLTYANELNFYKIIKDLYPNLKKMSYSQFVFCIYVFFELGVLSQNTEFGYEIKINEQIKSSLENSNLYNKIKLIQKIK